MSIVPSVIWVFFISLLHPAYSSATTDYARQTGMQCRECHVEAIGGGPLTRAGEEYLTEMKTKGLYKPLTKMQKFARLLVGYVHLITAIAWFGTIFYVHILLKPAYAAKGLPKGELLLGWISIIILTVTGILLTFARIPSWEVLYSTRFGILLSIKIFLFLFMASTAATVTFFIGPRLKKKLRKHWEGEISKGKQDLTLDELHGFDGKGGKPSFIAYKGRIFDVSQSRHWKDGIHLRKHQAGRDLTDTLKTAPHSEEKILALPVVGKVLESGQKVPRPFPERIFYLFAYTNLILVFLITLIIALWRWW